MRRWIAVLLILAAAVPAAAQQEEPPSTRMEWLPRPSLHVGHVLQLDFRVKLQFDWRNSPEEIPLDEGTFAFEKRRFGVEGELARDLQFEIEYEFKNDGAWTDVYANYRRFRNTQLQGGRFKLPFGLDQTTGDTNLDFVGRSAIGRDLSPGRDTGAMLHGRVLDDAVALVYEAGIFRHDGERSRFGENPGAGATFAGRVSLRPFRSAARDEPLGSMEVAFNTMAGEVPEGPGPNSLRARTVGSAPIFYEVYVKGRRTRIGAYLTWEPGPFSARSEFIQIWDDRHRQGLAAETLPRVGYGGWYIGGTWVVTGERKAGGVRPRNPLFKGGFGAVELAGRFDRIGFGSSDPSEPPEANPRAANLVETGLDTWTAGVNWYWNRWMRVQVNAIHEAFDDIEWSPVPGQTGFWTGICRLQFVL